MMRENYVGRFAPSPSGQLHFGSLVTAVASYLDAKHNKGKWLLRMEDIDEPRCVSGVDKDILYTLEQHGLFWDDEVIYQTQQHARYQSVVDELIDKQRAYLCTCTRKEIKAMGRQYNGHCRDRSIPLEAPNTAVRLRLNEQLSAFDDVIMGKFKLPQANCVAEDVVLKRRDGLFSYNLVVVLDDVFQQVNHVIRGYDLIDVTPLQRCVYEALGYEAPIYGHVPVASIAPGRKLSKQNHATQIDNKLAKDNLVKAIRFLGFDFPENKEFDSVTTLLDSAVSMWDRKKVLKTPEIIVPQHESTYYIQPF